VHKKIAALLSLSVLIILIIIIAWEDKQLESTPLPTENTTEILVEKDKMGQEDKRFKLGRKEDILPQVKPSVAEANISVPEIQLGSFTLINTKVKSRKVTVSDQKVIFQDAAQPIVMVNLFATWCPPCIGEIPYLNDLQKKYEKELLVVGILTHDSIVQDELETFMAKNQINYFISNGTDNETFATLLASTLDLSKNFPIPLTVMYVEGKYFTHYEGSVPVEMIEYDIQQAKKQLKAR
jgi:thiol-disulfide isomerase/thioredoxin